jgi:Kef-type K+ transport system membrane component KefB
LTFSVLAVIVLCGMAGPVLSGLSRLTAPVVVGEILAGVIVGESGFKYLPATDPTVVFLSAVGFAMLMFVVGTHLPLRDTRLRAALTVGVTGGVLSFVLAAPVGYALSRISGVGHPAIFLLLLAASSSAVVMPIIQEKGLTGDKVLATTAWVAIVDIATIVALPLAVTPGKAPKIAAGGVVVVAVAVAMFWVAHRLRRWKPLEQLRDYSRTRGWAFDLRLSMLVLFSLAALAAKFGTSTLIAGFAAGMIVALAGEPKRMTTQLIGLAEGFFVPFFFVALGAKLDFRSLVSSPSDLKLVVLLAIAIIACHLVVAVALRLPWPSGLLASAELGLPAGVVSLGLSQRIISAGNGAAIIAAAIVSLGASSLGAILLARIPASPAGPELPEPPAHA